MDVSAPVFCRHCGAELIPGRGDFYVVRIEAFAEPSGPRITAEELEKDHGQAMQEILAEMEGMSEQEAMDSVYRRMVFYLCRPCYARWIEAPTG